MLSKKPILLITASLIGSMEWCKQAPSSQHREQPGKSWKEVALEDFNYTLLRKPWTSNLPAERGIKFENQVYKKAVLPEDQLEGSKLFKEVVNYVRGGTYQKFYTKDVETEDCIYRFYGIFDVDKPTGIIDIKTTGKLNLGKYGGIQDKLYRWLSNKNSFTYVIGLWDVFPTLKSVNYVMVPKYSQEALETYCMEQAATFVKWLKSIGKYEIYKDCYCHLGLGWKSEIAKKGPEQEDKLNTFYKTYWDKYDKDNQDEEF